MDDVVTVTAKRTFTSSFVVAAQLWFGTASGYVSALVLAAIMAYVFHDAGSPWITAAAGVAWVALMIPFVLGLQAWRIARWYRTLGPPVFSFDPDSATCRCGEMVTRMPWSGIRRIRLTRKTCFVYITPRAAWFFAREEISRHDEAALLDFARRSGVQLDGKVAA
ncbi:YcxB family protein [Dyella soli]|uniref:YcxB family protein n=1 Tax=Dyella soli TaxID=522319 RepID=A0A4R0YLR6_9GAMM|nr:YcxB family protein [Dyella soli]TCI06381.1 YcxB family protein [Dyella soli]